MKTIDEIMSGVVELTPTERVQLRDWLNAVIDDDEWDRQIVEDAAAGRLDHLIGEARADVREGRTRMLRPGR